MHYGPHQLAYFAYKLTLRATTDSMDRMRARSLGAVEEYLLSAATAPTDPLDTIEQRKLSLLSDETERLAHQKLRRTLKTRRDKYIDEIEIRLRQEVDIHTVLTSQWRLQ